MKNHQFIEEDGGEKESSDVDVILIYNDTKRNNWINE